MFCIKTIIDSEVTGVYTFTSEIERTKWLCQRGFVDNHDIWYHPFSGEIAGIFSANSEPEIKNSQEYKTCTNRISMRRFHQCLIK